MDEQDYRGEDTSSDEDGESSLTQRAGRRSSRYIKVKRQNKIDIEQYDNIMRSLIGYDDADGSPRDERDKSDNDDPLTIN